MSERVSNEELSIHINQCGRAEFCYECAVSRDLLDARGERDLARQELLLQAADAEHSKKDNIELWQRIKELETVVVRVIDDVENGYFGFDPYYREIQEETMRALKESLHAVRGGGDE